MLWSIDKRICHPPSTFSQVGHDLPYEAWANCRCVHWPVAILLILNLPLILSLNHQRKEIDDIKDNNETVRLEAIRGMRDARCSAVPGASQELARLQDQAELFLTKIEGEKVGCDW